MLQNELEDRIHIFPGIILDVLAYGMKASDEIPLLVLPIMSIGMRFLGYLLPSVRTSSAWATTCCISASKS